MSGPNTLDLKLLHPTKEIVWVLQDADIELTNDWLNFTGVEYPENLDFVNKELINNSIDIFYPLLKEYLDSIFNNYLNQLMKITEHQILIVKIMIMILIIIIQ